MCNRVFNKHNIFCSHFCSESEKCKISNKCSKACGVTCDKPCKSVVIANDNPNIIYSISRSAKKIGCKVVGENYNGYDALRSALEIKPDIMIVSIELPGIDGIEITNRLKNVSPNTKIIIISSIYNQDIINLSYWAGAKFYLPLTFDELELEEVLLAS